jgi:hypothetical protein
MRLDRHITVDSGNVIGIFSAQILPRQERSDKADYASCIVTTEGKLFSKVAAPTLKKRLEKVYLP